ncbi:MAG TPA: RidA family protein [Hyphomonadaceae bacterium]|jgi:enamine deaminase RidA (YjgF/YER057c/UK114 family)|nr:RidA family protein [Hyphomonadaceae bacterium]
MSILERLKAAGVNLPEPRAPVANYVPFVITGNLLFISGQVSAAPEGLIKGTLGKDMTLEQGQAAAKICAINLIAQMQSALGDLERVTRIVKLGGFVNAATDFVNIPQVVNGCSDLMVTAFGDKGRHARSAVACPVLPMGAAVEVDAVVEFK